MHVPALHMSNLGSTPTFHMVLQALPGVIWALPNVFSCPPKEIISRSYFLPCTPFLKIRSLSVSVPSFKHCWVWLWRPQGITPHHWAPALNCPLRAAEGPGPQEHLWEVHTDKNKTKMPGQLVFIEVVASQS